MVSLYGQDSVEKTFLFGLELRVEGDNDFYSQRQTLANQNLPNTLSSLQKLPKYSRFECSISQVHKTGLGSSAAMVTSIVTCILGHFGIFKKEIVWKLAQLCHCAAQGKVGSGFDVSAAVYGSHIYQRFSPVILEDVLMGESTFELIKKCIERKWDHCILEFKMPRRISMVLGEIDTGSSTPKLVSKVLAWKNNPQNIINCTRSYTSHSFNL